MGTRIGRFRRGGWALAFLLVPALLSTLGQVGSTTALFGDHEQAAVTIGALGPTPPTVTPTTVIMSIHVGDRCESSPLAEVRTSSAWRVQLSVTASGWLETSDVEIMPTSIGPGEVAIVYFTKAAVGGPHPVTGQVVVTAEPGGHQTIITLGGSVENPAHASEDDDHPHTPACRSTPRSEYPEGESLDPEEPSLTGDGLPPADSAPEEETSSETAEAETSPETPDGTFEDTSEEAPEEEGAPVETSDSNAPELTSTEGG